MIFFFDEQVKVIETVDDPSSLDPVGRASQRDVIHLVVAGVRKSSQQLDATGPQTRYVVMFPTNLPRFKQGSVVVREDGSRLALTTSGVSVSPPMVALSTYTRYEAELTDEP